MILRDILNTADIMSFWQDKRIMRLLAIIQHDLISDGGEE
ncbi:unnamed protein product [marine sediment metagenome]|uniref:Uncharacterized protein n=1 Tax=marine sediment metagenome TaxID=412755 RepID=X1NF22_9ZZZZ